MFLTERTNKDAIVMVGRMNPPTAGHYRVIDQMKKYSRENGKGHELIVVVIAGKETSKDLQKNPLSPEDRIKFMTASGKANGVKFLTSDNAMNAFTAVKDAGYEPMVIAAGSDRADKYVEMLDEYFPVIRNDKKIPHKQVPGLDRNPSDEPVFGMDVKTISGSVARHAAKEGHYDEFAEIVGLDHKPKLAKILYDKVRKAMSSQKENK